MTNYYHKIDPDDKKNSLLDWVRLFCDTPVGLGVKPENLDQFPDNMGMTNADLLRHLHEHIWYFCLRDGDNVPNQRARWDAVALMSCELLRFNDKLKDIYDSGERLSSRQEIEVKKMFEDAPRLIDFLIASIEENRLSCGDPELDEKCKAMTELLYKVKKDVNNVVARSRNQASGPSV